MFSDLLMKNNPELIDYSFYLHQKRLIQPDTYILDFDAIIKNYQLITQKAQEYNLDTFVMTKQFGRHPHLIKALSELGTEFVAVDFREAQKIVESDGRLAHVGHLVQVPISMISTILQHRPQFVTVYSLEEVQKINEYAKFHNFVQNILIRVIKTAYAGQKTLSYNDEELLTFAQNITKCSHVKLVGLTTFPCFLFDQKEQKVLATDNTAELLRAFNLLKGQGFDLTVKNMPSHNNYSAIPLIASFGGTQIEPGHALTGTCPYHATFLNAQEEKIAMAYLSEVSHHDRDHSYIFGGGHYRRSCWKNVFTSDKKSYSVIFPEDSAIDYTIELDGKLSIGSPVLSSFRTQIFVTRSQVALVKGLSTNTPSLSGICDSQGVIIKEV